MNILKYVTIMVVNRKNKSIEELGGKMEREFTKEELQGMCSFLIETFEFTEEQTAAIDHQIPMTQEMYDSILDRCSEIGRDTDNLFYRMLDEYPNFMAVRAERMLNEIRDDDFSKSEENLEKWREKLYAKIRAKYGEKEI